MAGHDRPRRAGPPACITDLMDIPTTLPAQLGPLPAFRAMVAAGELAPDASQEHAAERLQRLWTQLRGYDPPPHPVSHGGGFLARLLRRRHAENQRRGRTDFTSSARSAAASPC